MRIPAIINGSASTITQQRMQIRGAEPNAVASGIPVGDDHFGPMRRSELETGILLVWCLLLTALARG
jgi:hypothetical protein